MPRGVYTRKKTSKALREAPELSRRKLESLRQQYISRFIFQADDKPVDCSELARLSEDICGVHLSAEQIAKLALDYGWQSQATHTQRLVEAQVAEALRHSEVKSRTQSLQESLVVAGITKKFGTSIIGMSLKAFEKLQKDLNAQGGPELTMAEVLRLAEFGQRMHDAARRGEDSIYAQHEALVIATEGGEAPEEALLKKEISKLPAGTLHEVLTMLGELASSDDDGEAPPTPTDEENDYDGSSEEADPEDYEDFEAHCDTDGDEEVGYEEDFGWDEEVEPEAEEDSPAAGTSVLLDGEWS